MYNNNRLVSFKSASSVAVYFRTFFFIQETRKNVYNVKPVY